VRSSIQGIYRGLVDKAWRAHCETENANAADKAEKERWYRKELLRTLNVYTTKQVFAVEDEDTLCLHFATLANDQREIHYWSRAEERRAIWVLRKTMNAAGVNLNYVRQMAIRMGFLTEKETLEDLPAELILKINAALDMHAHRRTRKEASYAGA